MSAALNMHRRIQGEQRFQIASRADRCVNWLKADGFEVLRVEASRITIKASPLCDKLEGAVEGFARNRKGEQRYKMVSRFDCAVVWSAPQDYWISAMNEMLAKRDKLTLPLKKHGYLLTIIEGYSSKAEAKQEASTEQQRGGRTSLRPRPSRKPAPSNSAADAHHLALCLLKPNHLRMT